MCRQGQGRRERRTGRCRCRRGFGSKLPNSKGRCLPMLGARLSMYGRSMSCATATWVTRRAPRSAHPSRRPRLMVSWTPIRPDVATRPSCTEEWPIVRAEKGAKPVGDWTIIKRKDGIEQWAYKDEALYTSVLDREPGD